MSSISWSIGRVKNPQACVDIINEADERLRKGALYKERINLIMVQNWMKDHLEANHYDLYWDGVWSI